MEKKLFELLIFSINSISASLQLPCNCFQAEAKNSSDGAIAFTRHGRVRLRRRLPPLRRAGSPVAAAVRLAGGRLPQQAQRHRPPGLLLQQRRRRRRAVVVVVVVPDLPHLPRHAALPRPRRHRVAPRRRRVSLAAANSAASPTAALAPAPSARPATCSCTGAAYYQRNATYVAVAGDTLLVIANDTFQGLSTCQAVQEQALGDAPARSLLAGSASPCRSVARARAPPRPPPA